MPLIDPIPSDLQRVERWANGAGGTSVILREPDAADWRFRASVAMVEHEGPFSELPDTRRLLVPLDSALTLRFPDGSERPVPRFGILRFDGAPAPLARLPEGTTRDFNLMLRGDAQADLYARTLVDSMVLPPDPAHLSARWLVYLASGHATLAGDADSQVQLNPGDAALVQPDRDTRQAVVRGGGEIVLARLYA